MTNVINSDESLEAPVGPEAVRAKIPDEDNPNGGGFGDIVTPGLANIGNQDRIQPHHNQVIDDQADDEDQEKLAKLFPFFTGAGLREGPEAIPDKVTDDGGAHRGGVGPEKMPTEDPFQDVEQAKIDESAKCADQGEFDEPAKFLGVGFVEVGDGF